MPPKRSKTKRDANQPSLIEYLNRTSVSLSDDSLLSSDRFIYSSPDNQRKRTRFENQDHRGSQSKRSRSHSESSEPSLPSHPRSIISRRAGSVPSSRGDTEVVDSNPNHPENPPSPTNRSVEVIEDTLRIIESEIVSPVRYQSDPDSTQDHARSQSSLDNNNEHGSSPPRGNGERIDEEKTDGPENQSQDDNHSLMDLDLLSFDDTPTEINPGNTKAIEHANDFDDDLLDNTIGSIKDQGVRLLTGMFLDILTGMLSDQLTTWTI